MNHWPTVRMATMDAVDELVDYIGAITYDEWRDILARQSPAVLPDVPHGAAAETVRPMGVYSVRPRV